MSAPFAPRRPLVVVELTGDHLNLAEQVWPALREALIRWHMDGDAELWRIDPRRYPDREPDHELVDPLALRQLGQLVGLSLAVFSPAVAAAASKHYGPPPGG